MAVLPRKFLAHGSRLYIEFQKFVKDIAVVNDAGERAVKAVQETVHQACSEKKLQRMLLVKSKISKPSSRTKAAYRAELFQYNREKLKSLAAVKLRAAWMMLMNIIYWQL